MEIRIEPGNEHSPRWIGANHKDDLLHGALLQAEKALERICEATKEFEDKQKTQSKLQMEELLYCFESNRIAFCGDRGQGKTSAMQSFARNLKNGENGQDFLLLPTIDPTMLEQKDSILNVILARMFQRARDVWEDDRNYGRRPNESIQRELTKCFQLCMEGVATNNRRKEQMPDEFGSLDQLEKLGDSAGLKQNFLKLAKNLLAFCGYSEKTGHIIIPLDDTDLQFQSAYGILEDLRKYLSIPHVILLMALHLDQMRDLVEKQYADYFGTRVNLEKIRLRASRYVDKMFPTKHVVFLPRFEHFCRDQHRTLKLFYGKFIPGKPLQEGMLRSVYRKTGLLFVVPPNYLHNMIPGNLRGLSHLLGLLFSMEDIPKADRQSIAITKETVSDLEKRSSIALRNLQMFEDYFLHEWCLAELAPTHAEILESASKVALSIQMEKLYHDIHDVVAKEDDAERCANRWGTASNKMGRPGVNEDGTIEKTAYYRLTALLDRIAMKRDVETYRFCFAVHTYITIQLHKVMWWTRDEAASKWREKKEQPEEGEVNVVEKLTYPDLEKILEGTLLLPSREGTPIGNTALEHAVPIDNLTKNVRDLPELPVLVRERKEQYCFDYTRPLLGILQKGTNWLTNDDKMSYLLQEACLLIVLNWDIQEQLRNLEPQKGKTYISVYDSLIDRLEKKNVYAVIRRQVRDVLQPILDMCGFLMKSHAYRAIFGETKTEKRESVLDDITGKGPEEIAQKSSGDMKEPSEKQK